MSANRQCGVWSIVGGLGLVAMMFGYIGHFGLTLQELNLLTAVVLLPLFAPWVRLFIIQRDDQPRLAWSALLAGVVAIAGCIVGMVAVSEAEFRRFGQGAWLLSFLILLPLAYFLNGVALSRSRLLGAFGAGVLLLAALTFALALLANFPNSVVFGLHAVLWILLGIALISAAVPSTDTSSS